MDDYISVKEAAVLLRVSERQVQKHAASGRVGSRTEGRRLFVLKVDVEKLAEEVGAHLREEPAKDGEMVVEQTGEFLNFIREQQSQISILSHRVGELEGQTKLLAAPDEVANIREENIRLKVENEQLRLSLAQRRPWYARVFR